MKKLSTLLLFFISTAFGLEAQVNINLYSQFHRGDMRYSGSWIYVAPDGIEYALLGARTGLAAYNMDSPDIVELGFVPGPHSNWRELTVVGNHAYVVTEGTGAGEGMQVVDLSYLPDSLHLLTTYTATFTRGHIVQRDVYSEDPYVYVNGVCGSCGINIIVVSAPANPVEVGNYNPGYYIHDCMVKGDRIYASAFYESQIDVVDISDKTHPVLIKTIEDPGANTHSTWITEDDRYLVICDEQTGLPMRILNVEDLENPFEVASYTASTESLVHNPYVLGDFLFVSHNGLGLRVLDIADPALPVEVAYHDTYPDGDSGSHGLWSACPFSTSGKIIGGNREDGIYIWTFNDTKAGRIYGTVKDSITGEVLYDAEVMLQPLDTILDIHLVESIFKYGTLAMEDLELSVTLAGYQPKSISFDMVEADSLWVEILLVPEGWVAANEPEMKEMVIAPNPTDGEVQVDLSQVEQVEYVVLFNIWGQEVYRVACKACDSVSLSLKDLPKGSYYVHVIGQGREIGLGWVLGL